jgi:hypothetical protein
MHPAVRVFGTLLRLVGISSPEDTAPRVATQKPASGPPSWRSFTAPSTVTAPPVSPSSPPEAGKPKPPAA